MFILGYLSVRTQAVSQDHHWQGPESVSHPPSTECTAGHLAAEQINNCSKILPGHQLKLSNIDSEACGINIVSKGSLMSMENL